MQAPGRDRDRPWVYHPHIFRGLSPLFHRKSTQELQLPGRGEGDTEGLVRKLSCCSGAAFRRKLLFPLGFRAWVCFFFFTSVKKKKNWIPRFAPIKKLHLYDFEKNKCIFFMPEIQRENRAGALEASTVQRRARHQSKNVPVMFWKM